jgi:tRNA pseudouridine13 synthase
MKLKQRPEDFSVTESWRFDEDPDGEWYVYLMDKQKLTTFQAVDRICEVARVRAADVSYCGLKDKQGRTTQLVAVRRKPVDVQEPSLRLKLVGRSASPLTSANTTSNRFAVTVRDLSEEDVARLAASAAEVRRIGVVNYFDSQRFGSLKHGQGFLVKDLMRGDAELALKNWLANPSALDHSGDAKVKGFWKEHWGEWERRNPHPGAERYDRVVGWLRRNPGDFLGAFLRTEPRWRALQVFTYQSWLWNEGVKQYLKDLVGMTRLLAIRYQAGALLFPRELDPDTARALRGSDFPLLAPGSTFRDPSVRRAALSVLEREGMTTADLRVKEAPQIHFDHEERPLLVFPGKLVVGEARRDELNRGRLKVNVAFTLPPGSYATLVVKRLFWWTLAPGARAARTAPGAGAAEAPGARRAAGTRAPTAAGAAAPPRRPTPEERHAERREKGFLAKKRARRAARQAKV